MLKKLTNLKKATLTRFKERTAMDYCGAICAANCDTVDPMAVLSRDVRY